METPIQIVVLRDHSNEAADEHVAMLRLAFEGASRSTESADAYLDGVIDLQIRVLDPPGVPREGVSVGRILASAARTVAVVVYSDADDVDAAATDLRAAVGADHVVDVKLPPKPTDSSIQTSHTGPVEPALLPVATALRAMECARRSLQQDIDPDAGVPRFFISHAKREGVPLALSLVGIFRQLRAATPNGPGFDYFYDVDHIQGGDVWPQAIEEAAKRCLLIVLRTDGYETRDWCRREYLWAEAHRMPILVIDMRTKSSHDGSLLPFDAAPAVRVHDGNVVRVVLHALATHLRALRVRRIAPTHCEILPHKPSVYSLAGARDALVGHAESRTPTIAYPNPPLPAEFEDVVQPMLTTGDGAYIPLVTYDRIDDGRS